MATTLFIILPITNEQLVSLSNLKMLLAVKNGSFALTYIHVHGWVFACINTALIYAKSFQQRCSTSLSIISKHVY